MKKISKKSLWTSLFLLSCFFVSCYGVASAQVYSTIEVGEGTIPAYSVPSVTSLTPFTRINFAAPFAPGVTPNVFPVTPEFGAGADDDPCLLRIRNIDNTGFDATCLEPRNEDRSSPGTSFEYIAIVNGTTNVPTTTGGNVRFESQCTFVNRQQFGPRCNNCTTTSGPAVGFQTVNFLSAFTGTPALLTQMVTINNTLAGSATVPGGEPEFLEAGVRSLNSSSFQVTLDRLEAGNGNISNGESVCYLAVQQQGCQTLDLTGLTGSVNSVAFQAVNGSNIDGHDNGATAGEGANFAAGCFTSTPVTVADQITRNGNNGGFMRRASVNAGQIILTVDEDRVSDSERSHIDELASVLAFGQTFTTPVTLTRMKIDQLDRQVTFSWQTTAETFHLGFNVWGETAQGWEQLNKRLIPGNGVSSDSVAEYQTRVRLTRKQHGEITRFGLSSVDNGGYEEFYGPFVAGAEYGETDTPQPIDWAATRQRYESSMLKRGYSQINGRWKKLSASAEKRLQRKLDRRFKKAVDVQFSGSGIRKVALDRLLAEQPSWQGKSIAKLAVTLNGKAVARFIQSQDKFISADDVIILNVVEPTGADAIYLNDYTYRILLDRSLAIAAPVQPSVYETEGFQARARVKQSLSSDQQYSAAIKGDDPYFDSELLTTGGAVAKTFRFIPDHKFVSDSSSMLSVSLFGSLDLPENVPDHHVQIEVNGSIVDDVRFDGLTQYEKDIELVSGLLTGVNDQVRIILPGDTGLFADLILIDRVSVSYTAELTGAALNNFSAEPNTSGFVVSDHLANESLVFAHAESGGFSKLSPVDSLDGLAFAALPSLNRSTQSNEPRYTVANVLDLLGPVDVSAVNAVLSQKNEADLLIISHPSFIGEALDRYVEFKQAEGRLVDVQSWLDIVEKDGHGNETPAALDRYLARLSEETEIRNVLLVGGHTYDYRGVLEREVINFLPTHYRRVGIFEYAPSDNVYADLDGDSRPEFAIGRWPVRSLDDLDAIVEKSIAWQLKRGTTNNQNALLIAQANDGRNLNFENALEGRVAPKLRALEQFDEPSRVYLNSIEPSPNAGVIEEARAQISQVINDGADWVAFSGHASTSGWGFQGIVNTDLIKQLRNQDDPIIVMPLACYTTNYQSLNVNTLAHQWLFAGAQGAAAVHGASMLGEYRENGILAERILGQSQQAETLGEAIMKAKREMTPVNEMLHNWTLLGDPTLAIK